MKPKHRLARGGSGVVILAGSITSGGRSRGRLVLLLAARGTTSVGSIRPDRGRGRLGKPDYGGGGGGRGGGGYRIGT